MECVNFPVFGDVPTFSETRVKHRPAALEFDHSAIEDCAYRGLWNGYGLLRSKSCRAGLKTTNERFILCCSDAVQHMGGCTQAENQPHRSEEHTSELQSPDH